MAAVPEARFVARYCWWWLPDHVRAKLPRWWHHLPQPSVDESRPHHSDPCRGLNRRTSWGQPHASAILPAHILAASSSATSTTVSPPRNSLVSTKGPSVNVSV